MEMYQKRSTLKAGFGCCLVFRSIAACISVLGATVLADQPAQISAPLKPDWPYDVDLGALQRLSTTPNKAEPPYTIPDENIPLSQRLFDVFAWKTFLALNWPSTAEGTPDESKPLTDVATPRVWEHLVDVALVYQQDGAPPADWLAAVKATWDRQTLWMAGMGLGKPGNPPKGSDQYRPPLVDESLQAFTGPMIDQAGNWVRYEVLLNSVEFDYLVKNKLYNLEGQAAYAARGHKIEFPANDGTTSRGSMEVKLAWKQMEDRDDPKRFLIRNCRVVKLDGSTTNVDLGLVGMHIAVRARSSPTWIWTTFEQIDNVSVNDLERNSNGRNLRPSFFNPDYPTKPVNQLAPKNAAPVNSYNPATGADDGPPQFTSWDESKTTDPTQATMVIPVPKATDSLNIEVRRILAQMDSVFQYYELIGTQWPSDPEFPAFPNGVAAQADGRLLPAAPESIIYKIPGKVVPVYVINTTMETFFQGGNQPAGPSASDPRLPPGLVADPSIIFGTESCAGCHFSAGACIKFKQDQAGRYLVQNINGKNYRVPIFGLNANRGLTGSADYSWLMQLRSQSAPYTGSDIVPITSALVPNNQKICPAK
jgi:hypothetical protein